MKVIVISDCGEITSVCTLKRFIQEVNKLYGSEYFTIDTIQQAINWYCDKMILGVDLINVQTSINDEV